MTNTNEQEQHKWCSLWPCYLLDNEILPYAAIDEDIDLIEEDEFLPSTTPTFIRRSSTEWSSSVYFEILNFYHERDQNINILYKYPIIRRIYRRFNTTFSALRPVERLFSQALLMFTPRRNRISDDNFEKALLLQKKLWIMVPITIVRQCLIKQINTRWKYHQNIWEFSDHM